MRKPLLLALIVLIALPTTAQAAQASGELTSDAPVQLFGDGRAIGENITAYHHSFRDGSLSGSVYSGRLVEHSYTRVRSPDPACEQSTDGEWQTFTRRQVDPHTPYNATSYGLDTGAYARLLFPNDAVFGIGQVGEPASTTEPFLYLGPNPYPDKNEFSASHEQGFGSSGESGREPPAPEIPAFPVSPFAAVPATAFNTISALTLELHWGTMRTVQLENEHVHEAGVFAMTRPHPNPTPLTPSTCDIEVTRWFEFTMTVAATRIDQAGAERALAYWRGEAAREGSTGRAGMWPREDATGAAAALETYSLPATIVAAPDFVIEAEGEALFERALGSIEMGGRLYEAQDARVRIAGLLQLRPVASDGATRITTHVGGDARSIVVGEDKGESLTWTLDVPMAAGIVGAAAVFGGAAWAWPVLKFKGTQWLLFPLYARLKKEDLLENPLRDDILVAVQQSPGISASDLGRRLECGWGTLVYHLTVLERMQLISSAREGRHKRFFVQGRINYSDKAAVGLLANPSARTILDAIKERPGLIQRDLGRLLGLSPGTVAWHVDRLEEGGLIIKEADGRVVRYYPSAKLIELTKQLAA